MPALNVASLFNSMLGAAKTTAAKSWAQIASVATHEFQVVAHRIVQISKGLAAGELTKQDAKNLMRLTKNHMVAIIATMTTMVLAGVEKIINAAFAAIRTAVNTVVGFAFV